MVKVRRFGWSEGEIDNGRVIEVPSFTVRAIKQLYRSKVQLEDEEEWSDEDFFSTLDIQKRKDVIAVVDTEYDTGTEFFVRVG